MEFTKTKNKNAAQVTDIYNHVTVYGLCQWSVKMNTLYVYFRRKRFQRNLSKVKYVYFGKIEFRRNLSPTLVGESVHVYFGPK